jgi:hypothetical protein
MNRQTLRMMLLLVSFAAFPLAVVRKNRCLVSVYIQKHYTWRIK